MYKYNINGCSCFVGSKLIAKLDLRFCRNTDKNLSHFFNEITNIGDIRFLD